MELLYFFAEHRNTFFNILQDVVMNIGSELFLMGIICFLYWAHDKHLAVKIGFAYFYSGLLVQGLKIALRIPRPWVIDTKFEPLASAKPTATGYSFPSGHSQTAAAVMGTLFMEIKKTPLRVLFAVLLLAVGWSRMYAGVHTPYDVAAAIVLTLVVVVVLYWLWKKATKESAASISIGDSASKDSFREMTYKLSIILIVLSILSGVYCLLMYRFLVLVDYANVSDLVKLSGASLGFGMGAILENRFVRFSTQGTLPRKLLRVLAGLAVLVLLKTVLKLAFSPLGLIGDFLRYTLLILWIMVLYPMLWKHNE